MSAVPRGYDAGFTLLELLIAMTLLALLSLVLFGGLKFGRQAWSTAATGTIRANHVRGFQDELRRDIERAYPAFIDDPFHPRVDFTGSASQLMLLAPAHGGGAGLERLVIATTGGAVALAARPELANSATPTYTKVLEGVGAVQFSYFGKEAGDKSVAWHRDWQGQTRLPLLVKIDSDAARSNWPSFIVAPRIAADQSCVFDRTVSFCHGR